MKMHNIALALVATCIASMYAKTGIGIKNEYSEPITINIGDYTKVLPETTGYVALMYDTPAEIRAAGNLVRISSKGAWHRGIQKGFTIAAEAAEKYPTAHVVETVTILNSSPLKANFD